MRKTLAVLTIPLVCCLGCGDLLQNQKAEPTKHRPPIHRFENVSEHAASPGVALDTVTGQLCRTWDWNYKNESLSGGLDTIPTCKSIFDSTPSNDDNSSPPVGSAARQ